MSQNDDDIEPDPLSIDEAINRETDPIYREYLKAVKMRDEMVECGKLDPLDPSRWKILDEIFAKFNNARSESRIPN